MMAVAGLFASCQSNLEPVVVDEVVNVSIEVGTPEVATRAYSDGTTATVLQYAVYDAEGKKLDVFTKTDAEIHGKTTVDLQLTTGNTYNVLFWAAAPDAPYTVDLTNKTMKVDYTGVLSNSENLDAFYKWETIEVTGAMSKTVELKRPFAQLNVGTNDFAEAAATGYEPTKSYVKVTSIYNTLNLAGEKYDNGLDVTGEVEVEFALNTIPSGETFPVVHYDYLAMNYLLVGNEKEVVDVEFGYQADGEAEPRVRTVGSVPVQRNHRTNLYGQLLTSDVKINVEIKPEYDEPAHELDALHKAALNGGEVTLTEDVVLTTTLEVVGNMTINLNGKTISAEIHKSVGPVIKNNGTLTIKGGTISSLANNGGSAIANYGDLTVEDVTLNGAPREGESWPAYPINNYGNMTLTNAVVTGYQGCVALNAAGTTVLNNCELTKNYEKTSSHVFYVNHADAKVVVNGGTYNHNGFDGSLAYVIKGEVTINGGTFNAKDGGYGFAVLSAGKVTVNDGNINAGLLNWGGKFVVNGGVYTSKPNENFISEGYKVVKKGDKWYVVADDVDVVASGAELSTALAAGQNVVLVSDVDITKIDLTKGADDVVIDANGHKITTASNYGIEISAGKNVTVKNAEIVITVDGNYITYAAGIKINNGDYAGQTIAFENCELRMKNTDWAYAVNMPANVKNLNLVIDNCVFEGAIALQCWGDNNKITINGGEMICNYTTSAMYTSYCVVLQGDGSSYAAENNVLSISDTKFSYSGVDNFNSKIYSVSDVSNSNTNQIIVSNCTYEGVEAY